MNINIKKNRKFKCCGISRSKWIRPLNDCFCNRSKWNFQNYEIRYSVGLNSILILECKYWLNALTFRSLIVSPYWLLKSLPIACRILQNSLQWILMIFFLELLMMLCHVAVGRIYLWTIWKTGTFTCISLLADVELLMLRVDLLSFIYWNFIEPKRYLEPESIECEQIIILY